MSYFPFFVDLQDAPALIVGGGTVALRKAEKLLPYGAEVTVIAPEICAELKALPVKTEQRCFQAEDIDEHWQLVVAASDDVGANRLIARLCREQRIPVNVVDVQEECSFVFPCLIQRGKLSIGISSSGSSPTLAIHLKNQVSQLIPDQVEELLDFLEAQRKWVRAEIPTEPQRARLYKTMLEQCLALGRTLTQREIAALVSERTKE